MIYMLTEFGTLSCDHKSTYVSQPEPVKQVNITVQNAFMPYFVRCMQMKYGQQRLICSFTEAFSC